MRTVAAAAVLVVVLAAPIAAAEPTTLEDCLLEHLPQIQTDAAVRGVIYACRKKFPAIARQRTPVTDPALVGRLDAAADHAQLDPSGNMLALAERTALLHACAFSDDYAALSRSQRAQHERLENRLRNMVRALNRIDGEGDLLTVHDIVAAALMESPGYVADARARYGPCGARLIVEIGSYVSEAEGRLYRALSEFPAQR